METFLILDRYSNLIIATMAFLAFIISISQANSNRKHNRLSVRPALCHWLETNDAGFVFKVSKNGVGPAIIKDTAVLIRGNQLSSTNEKIIQTAVNSLFDGFDYEIKSSFFNYDYVFSTNEEVIVK